MEIINTLDNDFRANFARILNRSNEDYSKLIPFVLEELEKIKKYGLSIILENIAKFDKWSPKNFQDLKVDFNKAEDAFKKLDSKLKDALKIAYDRIYTFQEAQKPKGFIKFDEYGNILGTQVYPMDRVGIYVPGGKAFYPSSVLMNAIPAIVAGVKNIICFNPVNENKENELILSALYLCNIQECYKVGGISAIGMGAYGLKGEFNGADSKNSMIEDILQASFLESNNLFEKVDLITGPGNIFVALAKKLVFGEVGIDMIAGPSEIGIIADSSADPKTLALDLLSQAEHDERASAILITDSQRVANETKREIEILLKTIKRKDIASVSIREKGVIVVVKDMEEAVFLMEKIAPEHLEIITLNPFDILPKIKNAGAIFLGKFTPEVIGDYIAGPNHTLPTGGSARFFSPLSTEHFYKKSSIISFSKDGVKALGGHCSTLASAEFLQAHCLSVLKRLED